MSNKKHKTNEQTELNQQQKQEEKTIGQEAKQAAKKPNQLEIELNNQKEINKQLLIKITKLEQQVEQLNADFINQVQAKAEQAKTVLNQKLEQLEQAHAQKVSDAVYKIFSQKFDRLLVAINHFSKITDRKYDDEKLNAFIQGFNMISNQMIDGLDDLEISRIIPSVGQLIDDSCMEAVELVPSTNQQSLTIVEVIETGFKYKDKVIKYATVKVAQ